MSAVRYDNRGHGGSPVPAGPYSLDDLADDLVGLLDRLGVARAHQQPGVITPAIIEHLKDTA